MELLLERKYKKETYTIGNLYFIEDGKRVWFCNVIEDKDRGLKQSDALAYIKRQKVYGQTAIPTGKYQISLGVFSPKFSKRKAYDFCGGCPPLLLNVKGYSGIRIHGGNTAEDSLGCLICGKNTQKGRVTDSLNTLKRLYEKLKTATGLIFITIQ